MGLPCSVHNLLCGVRLKFSGGKGDDKFKTPLSPPPPPPPTNNICLYLPPVLRCFWKDPLMTSTPITLLQASFTSQVLSSTMYRS